MFLKFSESSLNQSSHVNSHQSKNQFYRKQIRSATWNIYVYAPILATFPLISLSDFSTHTSAPSIISTAFSLRCKTFSISCLVVFHISSQIVGCEFFCVLFSKRKFERQKRKVKIERGLLCNLARNPLISQRALMKRDYKCEKEVPKKREWSRMNCKIRRERRIGESHENFNTWK